MLDTRELGRRPGSMRTVRRSVPAPEGLGTEVVGVPAGSDLELDLRLEAVMEGVLVSGEVDVPVAGSCARCLEPIEDTLELDVQELFAYEGSTTEETIEEDEVRLVENDRIDLEPMIRDLVVLSLPLALFLPPRFARCSTPHRHGLKSAFVHRFLKSVKSMMPSPRVNLVKC